MSAETLAEFLQSTRAACYERSQATEPDGLSSDYWLGRMDGLISVQNWLWDTEAVLRSPTAGKGET